VGQGQIEVVEDGKQLGNQAFRGVFLEFFLFLDEPFLEIFRFGKGAKALVRLGGEFGAQAFDGFLRAGRGGLGRRFGRGFRVERFFLRGHVSSTTSVWARRKAGLRRAVATRMVLF